MITKLLPGSDCMDPCKCGHAWVEHDFKHKAAKKREPCQVAGCACADFDRDRVAHFQRDLRDLCQRHGMTLWHGDTCYECGAGELRLVDQAAVPADGRGTLDLATLTWHDLAAEQAEEAAFEAERERIQALWRAQAVANRRLGNALKPVFERYGLVFWAPVRNHDQSAVREVRALPFTEGRAATLFRHAALRPNPLRNLALAERQLTNVHRAAQWAFLQDALLAMRAVGLVPVPFGEAGIQETEPSWRWQRDATEARIFVSPRFDDPLPAWLFPEPTPDDDEKEEDA